MSKELGRSAGDDGADSVDPYEYAEAIVRDLAAQLGARLRDVRSDVAALQSALAGLPETLKLQAIGQAVEQVQAQVAALSGTVTKQGQAAVTEAQLSQQLGQLAERIGSVEAYLARRPQGNTAQRRARLLDDIAREYL